MNCGLCGGLETITEYGEKWACPACKEKENLNYLESLKPGDKVIETEKSSCMYGKKGTVYLNSQGSTCVLWETPDGKLGTSVTWGTKLNQ